MRYDPDLYGPPEENNENPEEEDYFVELFSQAAWDMDEQEAENDE